MTETLSKHEQPEHFEVHHENGEALMCLSSGGECRVLVEVVSGYSPEEEQQLIASTAGALEAIDRFTNGKAADIFAGLHIKVGEDLIDGGARAYAEHNSVLLNGRKMLMSVAEMRQASGAYSDEELAGFPDERRPGGALEYTLVHEIGHILDGQAQSGESYHRVAATESPTAYGRDPDQWHSDNKDHEAFAEGFAHAVYDMPVSEAMEATVRETVATRAREVASQETDRVNNEFQKKFEEQKARLERIFQTKQERLTHLKESVVPQRVESYTERHGESPPDEWVAALTASAEQSLKNSEWQLEFLRPSSEEDRAYRLKVMKELPKRILESTPPDLPLRFHGAPIYTSREIIASKGLSSSVDRLGVETSYDVSDQVSVTMSDTIKVTLDSYTGLAGEHEVPAGCVFVLLPKSEEDSRSGVHMLMGNVDFEEHPNRLFAVMTSGENVERVRQWAQDSGLDSTKVKEFFEFADELSELKSDVEQGKVNPQEYVSYELPSKS